MALLASLNLQSFLKFILLFLLYQTMFWEHNFSALVASSSRVECLSSLTVPGWGGYFQQNRKKTKRETQLSLKSYQEKNNVILLINNSYKIGKNKSYMTDFQLLTHIIHKEITNACSSKIRTKETRKIRKSQTYLEWKMFSYYVNVTT